ncbi:MAG: efflux RND transporter periplasmic adaptor subunit [Ferruginibacter sp.]
MKNLKVFSIIVFMLASCGGKKEKISANAKPAGPPPPPRVEGYVVKTIPVSDNIKLPGSIIANEATEIHPETSGRLTYLNVAEGRNVGSGALIGKIYDGDLRAQLSKLNVQLQQAQRTAKRYEELLKIQGVSRQEYDMHVLDINNIRADMAIVQSNLKRTEIRAPFSGTLGLKNISPGAYITPATVLTSIRQNNQLKLDFTLPEKYAAKIHAGQLVNFTVENNPKLYGAKIAATEMSISEESRSLNVRAIVLNNDGKILPGAFVEVVTNFEPDPTAIMVPTQAVIPQARGKKIAVYRNGIASFDNVETGIRDSSMVQITSGLKVGDTIIVSGLMGLKPGGKVVISKVKN